MSAARLPRVILSLLKWSVVVVIALMLLAVGYTWYVITSHDSVNLPPNHGKVRDDLLLGDGDRQPLLVNIGGSEGGNTWTRDYWKPQRERFLQQGYASLAIGYFGMEGTPEKLDRIALEGVYDAIRRAAAHPQIDARCIVLMGGSKGAELVLSLAARYPDIDGVVAIVPGMAVFPGITDAMTTSSFTWQGEPLPFVPVPWSTTWPLITGDLLRVSEIMLEDAAAVANAVIPVEKINGPILFVSASHDELWPSRAMSDAMMQRLELHGFPHAHEHIIIDGGHTSPSRHFKGVEAFLDRLRKADPASACHRA